MDLTQQEWAQKAANDNNVIILDVRTEDEFNDGYIPNAVLNDIYGGQAFIYRLDELDKTKNYYVYCRSGGRSSQACNIMQQLGFLSVFNLVGGYSEWQGEVVQP